ncbi:hypothetical protein SAMN05444266_101621 [Chitinophaga jiangningensis]|uniref:Uncharacterized protein n=1 Tax=Chitinophaga jiangningensis TaxID=1419482 RepID=A0A1M6WH30_9BACT|nr:hypothetical protein [Chitinophaga jiangningensis]SHK92959.1 hypothetical protein SAMN05444266_101621 [Chitinophaga jiangningensis]
MPLLTVLDFAGKIPAEYRREILATNMIYHAVANAGDASMFYLFTIWSNYIEPGLQIGCGACLERILHNFKEMQPHLVTLEQQNKLLQSL